MRSQPRDPFGSVPLTVEYVDSAAGSRKTFTGLALAMDAAKRGRKTIFAMPTLELINEMADFARRDPAVRVHVITHQTVSVRQSIDKAICDHIAHAGYGHIVFITHEGLTRVLEWPQRISEYHLIIDEVLDVILTRTPFHLRYSWRELTLFLDTAAMPATVAERRAARPGRGGQPTWTIRDLDRLRVVQQLVDPTARAAPAEVDMARQQLDQLQAKQAAATDDNLIAVYRQWLARALEANRDNRNRYSDEELEQVGREVLRLESQQDDGERTGTSAAPYYRILPNANPGWTELRARNTEVDDVFKLLAPIPRWMLEGAPLFSDIERWNKMIGLGLQPGQRRPPDAGLITISGFRRPDFLTGFGRVTMMSALFRHTMLYAVWSKLGVDFQPSTEIRMAVTTTSLGRRRLRLYWLTQQPWSKAARDKAGGIVEILRLIDRARVIDPQQPVCVVVNKDDGSEQNPAVVTGVFANGMVMPHNTRGQNRWRGFNQLIYCAALNSYTPDIRWLEQVLGIDAHHQRIARLGQEVYQTAMRLSLREPSSTTDVTIVVIDKDVAEWLVQWFEPDSQVEIAEIDSSGVIRPHGRPGRPTIGERPMSGYERLRRHRLRQRGQEPPSQDE